MLGAAAAGLALPKPEPSSEGGATAAGEGRERKTARKATGKGSGSAASASSASSAGATTGTATTQAQQEQVPNTDRTPRTGTGGNNLLRNVARLTTQNARRIALLSSATFKFITFSSTTDLGKLVGDKSKQTTKAFEELSKKSTPAQRQTLYSAHIFVLLELAQTLLGFAQGVDSEAAKGWVNTIKQFLNNVDKNADEYVQDHGLEKQVATRLAVADHISVMKISKCYDNTKLKAEITHASEDGAKFVQCFMEMLIAHAKGRKGVGAAPQNNLERQINRAINMHRVADLD